MKFTFRQFPVQESQAFPGQSTIQRPVIPVTLVNPKDDTKQITLHCAIDSGSDHCMFPTNIAFPLGLSELESNPTWIWSGSEDKTMVAYAHPIILELEGFRWEMQALFSNDLNNAPYGILGLDGFFDHFNIQIDFKSQQIELTPNT